MKSAPKRILIIQTAFIGDVILATSLIEFFKGVFEEATIDFLLRKSNASILKNDPRIDKLIEWDKKQSKIKGLSGIIRQIRKEQYDYVINTHRFASSGLMTVFSGATTTIGYDKNPLSFLFSKKVKHEIGDGRHEVDRLLELVEDISPVKYKPRLSIPTKAIEKVKQYNNAPYLVIAPNSVWFTKQFPMEKWVEFIDQTAFEGNIYLIGAPSERDAAQKIIDACSRESVFNLCGDLSLLESAALMQNAIMNYTNDSGPMHLCSAVNAPVRAIYCSTVPDFGFGPLSDDSAIVQTHENLSCRPCGLHGHKACPEGHFKCGYSIDWRQLEIKHGSSPN
ncbi:MAG: glycosyltransferase family 9 protein [Bacteroidota bacterium]